MTLSDETLRIAKGAAGEIDADVFLYNGRIQRGRALVAALGQHARFEVTRGNEVDMHALSERRDSAHQEVDGHAADHDGGEPAPNGGDSPGAVPEADPAAKAGRGRGAKSIPPSDSGGGSDVAAATI